jgi:hypothetical protein
MEKEKFGVRRVNSLFSFKAHLRKKGINTSDPEFLSGFTPRCIKIDVDGTEVEILEGAAKTPSDQELRTTLIETPDNAVHSIKSEGLIKHAGFSLDWVDASGASTNQIWERRA